MNQVHMLPSVVGRRSGKEVSGAIRSPVNAMNLQLECARVPVLLYGSETIMSRVGVAQMDSLSDLLGIRGVDRVPN